MPHNTPRWFAERRSLFGDSVLAPHHVPILSDSERERRWSAVRSAMREEGLSSLLLVGNSLMWGAGMANIRYLTQVGSFNGAEAIFTLEGRPLVFTGWYHSSVPFHIMEHAGAWCDIAPRIGIEHVVKELVQRGEESGKIGLVGYTDSQNLYGNVSHGLVLRAQELLPKAEFVDATGILERIRMRKSSEELSIMREAGRIAKARIQKLIDVARPGVTEAEVWSAMFQEQIELGGEAQAFNMLISGPTSGAEGVVQHLLHGVEAPQAPTGRVLEEGDLVVCEMHTQYAGYLAATEYSVVLGKAPEPLKRLHEACMEYIGRAKTLFMPGRSLRSTLNEIHEIFESEGFDWVECGFHGHGLSSPEFPTAVYRAEDLDRMRPGLLDNEFEAGMVLGMNIDPHDPGWRRDVGVMFGDMVHVSDAGGELMINIPTDVFEVG